MNNKVGLIGYGHLGKAVEKRAKDQGINISVSSGQGYNQEVVKGAELVILTVRPGQVEGVIKEVHSVLSHNVEVLSFAAALPAEFIAEGINRRVVRAMTDINFRQVITQAGANSASFCSQLSKNPVLTKSTDWDMDIFTVLIGCLPGVAAWQFANNTECSNEWLEDYADFIAEEIKVPKAVSSEIIKEVKVAGDYNDQVRAVATSGGVTEALIKSLEFDAELTPSFLAAAGIRRINEIKNILIRKNN